MQHRGLRSDFERVQLGDVVDARLDHFLDLFPGESVRGRGQSSALEKHLERIEGRVLVFEVADENVVGGPSDLSYSRLLQTDYLVDQVVDL